MGKPCAPCCRKQNVGLGHARLSIAARDRFGIKPLYYAVHDETLYLASEIKALFAAGVPPRWDHEYAIWHSETLFLNGHGVSKYLLSRAVSNAGYKVVYTGEGSDEIFGGYVHCAAPPSRRYPFMIRRKSSLCSTNCPRCRIRNVLDGIQY